MCGACGDGYEAGIENCECNGDRYAESSVKEARLAEAAKSEARARSKIAGLFDQLKRRGRVTSKKLVSCRHPVRGLLFGTVGTKTLGGRHVDQR